MSKAQCYLSDILTPHWLAHWINYLHKSTTQSCFENQDTVSGGVALVLLLGRSLKSMRPSLTDLQPLKSHQTGSQRKASYRGPLWQGFEILRTKKQGRH